MQGTSKIPIDLSKLSFEIFDSKINDISNLDFTIYDGKDPLDVDRFIRENSIKEDKSNIIYIEKYYGKIVGYFSVSMSRIGTDKLDENTRAKLDHIKNYPALLLGHIGIDKKHRKVGFLDFIIKFSTGLGVYMQSMTGCSFLITYTTRELAEKYYVPKYKFNYKKSEKSKVWIYKRLF